MEVKSYQTPKKLDGARKHAAAAAPSGPSFEKSTVEAIYARWGKSGEEEQRLSGQFYALSHRRIKFKELRLQFLDGLETALFKRAVTDSEGRFKLMVPIRGKHFLLAKAAIEDGSKEKN